MIPASRGFITLSGEKVYRKVEYLPDFAVLGRSVVVEAKGRFDAAHRSKALAFRDQYPSILYAMVFEADNKLSKSSSTRYSGWCEKQKIPYKIGLVTREWLEEITE